MRNLGVDGPNPYPKQFWFLVPYALAERVKRELPPWAGLLKMTDEPATIQQEVLAPINRESRKLTAKECVQLAHCMANQILSFTSILSNWEGIRFEGWVEEYSI